VNRIAAPADLLPLLVAAAVTPFDAIANVLQDGLRPEPDTTISEWADAHRVLAGKGGSAEPGPFRSDRAPFCREIADALSPSNRAQRVVFMKASQIGGTEIGNNFVGFIIAMTPGPVMVVQPTLMMARRFSRQRLDSMIASTPALRAKVQPARSRDSGNTILQKDFPGGTVVVTSANSAVGLRSMPVRFLFLDEVDAYEPDVGGEGDPVALAEARQRTFGFRKKTFVVSSPKLAGRSTIEREYQASDQRRYFVPCPHCGQMQFLRFEQLHWTKGKPETAAYHCEECGAAATEADKTEMLARGEWRATARPSDPTCTGFHISSLYSPVGWFSWARIARDWEKAMTGGPEAIKTFKNTVLGETWQEKGQAPDWERLFERREPFKFGVVPRGVLVLTAAVDNQAQPARLEISVWGWAAGYESWLVDHQVIDGDPAGDATWDAVRVILDRDWPREHGGTMRISEMAVDTGGQSTSGLYNQIRRMQDRRVLAIKGTGGWNRSAPVSGPVMVDVRSGGRKITRGLRLWTVAVDVFKGDLYRRLWLARGEDGAFPPGWVHLPDSMDAEAVKQLVAEELVTVKDRRGFAHVEWRKLHAANEQLDLAVYARAALSVLGSDRYGDRFWTRLLQKQETVARTIEAPPSPPPPSPTAPQVQGPVYAKPTGLTITIKGERSRRLAGRLAGA
jgi:phage terminase large subunit GpA-like protein